MKQLIALLFALNVFYLAAQQKTTVKEYLQEYTTYPFSDPSPVALLSEVYPYFRFDGFTDTPVKKKWKVVALENDYIKVIILPEVGGKIWAAFEKNSGRSFIYNNQVVKFRDIGMRGPWTSGGLEANYGIIGHTPNTATPVDYTTTQHPDGSASCFIGVLDLLTRSQWRIEINLPKDKAYFTTRSFWYNNTATNQPYYHWMNLGMPAKGNLEFVFPGTHYIGHEGEYADWPVNKENGKRINFYEENDFGGPKSYHVIGKPADFFGAYYHDADNGMVRYGTYDDKAGRKIWIWGLSRQGMIWEKLLTDTDGQYVEIQSGRLFNQNAGKSSFTPFKHTSFAPYGSDGWKEYWYPVAQTKGIAKANEYGTLNCKQENGLLKIYFSAVQPINDELIISANGKTLYSKNIKLSPLQTFADSLRIQIPEDAIAVLGDNKLIYSFNPKADELSRPLASPADFNWNTAYGEYLQGRELMDQKHYAQSELHLKKSLELDNNFLPALIQMAALQYRNIQYAAALATIKRAMQIDTHSGESNYYYGLINEALGNIIDARDGYSLATLTNEYRSAAYTALARLAGKEKRYPLSLDYADKAIAFNQFNLDALMLKSVSLRESKQSDALQTTLTTILQQDPLNHFAGFERYLQNPTEVNKRHFVASVRNELPAETFNELAVWYYNAGYPSTALQLFQLSANNAEAILWQAYLKNEKPNVDIINPAFAFPFRSETALVLEKLVQQQDHWFLKYQLALVYRDRNRMDECRALLAGCDNANFAPLFIVRANLSTDKNARLKDLQKAVALDPASWRYTKLLTEYYISNNELAKALATIAPFYQKNKDHMITGMLYAKTLLLNKKFKEADALLTKINIIPFEGATEGRFLYREAKLMQALDAIKKKNAAKAKKFIEAAKLWPENLGVGKPYENEIDYRLENWIEYLADNRKSETVLNNIVGFTPKVENTVANFIPSNALVSAWAISQQRGNDAALQWIDEQIAKFPASAKVLKWSRDMFEKGTADQFNQQDKDAGMRILEAISGL